VRCRQTRCIECMAEEAIPIRLSISTVQYAGLKKPRFFKKPKVVGFLGFIGFWGFIAFFGQAGKIGKIIQKLSNLKV